MKYFGNIFCNMHRIKCRKRKRKPKTILHRKTDKNEGTGDTNWHEFDTNLRKKTGRIKCRMQRGEAAIKEDPNRETRQRRENAEIRAAVFRIFGVFRGSVLREILAGCEQLRLLQWRERKNLDLKKLSIAFSDRQC